MKRLLLSIFLLIFILAPLPAHAASRLIVDDEFDVLSPGWLMCFNWGCGIPTNLELETYTPDNVYISGGVLHLRALKQGNIYTSGMINGPGGRVSFTYGRLEVRAKLPAGQGLWPAIWLLTDDASPAVNAEIDVKEATGDNQYRVIQAYHTLNLQFGDATKAYVANTASWHIYSLDWSAHQVKWYVDGRLTRESAIDEWWIPHSSMYPLINLAVGGSLPGPVGKTTKFPAEMLVDYIRIYQN